jgi:hypothetical protein
MTSKFNLKEIKCFKISLIDLSIRLEKVDEIHVIKSNSQLIYAYQQRIESLNFAAVISRSDIAFATAKLTQFLQASHSNHFSAIDQIISYLYKIRNLVIEYFDKRLTNILLCVSDATFADDEITRRSFDEYLFQLYDDLIDWRTAKHTIVIISEHWDWVIDTDSNRQESYVMKTFLWDYTIWFDEDASHSMRQSSDISHSVKRCSQTRH